MPIWIPTAASTWGAARDMLQVVLNVRTLVSSGLYETFKHRNNGTSVVREFNPFDIPL